MTYSTSHSSRANIKSYYDNNNISDQSLSLQGKLPLLLVQAIYDTDLSTLQVTLLQLCKQNDTFRDLLSGGLVRSGEEIDSLHLGTTAEKLESERLEKGNEVESEKGVKIKRRKKSSLLDDKGKDKEMFGLGGGNDEEEVEEIGSGYSSDTSDREETKLLEGEAICGQCTKKFNTLLSENDYSKICRWHPGVKQWNLDEEEADKYWGFRVRPFVDLDDDDVQDKVKWSCCGKYGHYKWCKDGKHKAI